MPRPGWTGRRVTAALNQLHRNTHPPTCWLCGHPCTRAQASIDHVLPARDYPDLEWSPTNWRLAHRTRAGTPTGCPVHGCSCIGNVGRGTDSVTAPATRDW